MYSSDNGYISSFNEALNDTVDILASIVDNVTIELTSADILQVKALGISSTQLNTNAVTTTKILNDNVTTAKIADDAITTLKILDSAITNVKIYDVNASKIVFDTTINTRSLLPQLNDTYTFGSSANRWLTGDITTLYGTTISTRSGTLALSPNNSTVQIPAQVWNNRNATGGATSTMFSQQHYFASSSGGGTALYFGVLTDTLNRGTIQALTATGPTGIPLCIQPNSGANSILIIGAYDAGAQANTDKVYINGDVTINGTLTPTTIALSSLSTSGVISTTNTTDSTSTSTGSIITSGGVGIAKNIWIGGSTETSKINETSDALTIGNSSGSLHSLIIIGDVTISTTPSTGTIGIGNNNSVMTLRGAPININSSGTTDTNIGSASGGITTIIGTPININATGTSNTNIGSSSGGTVTNAGTHKYNVGFSFPNQTSDETVFGTYAKRTYSDTFTGVYSVNPTVDVHITKEGSWVNIEIEAFAATANGGSSARLTFSTTLPAQYRPLNGTYRFQCVVLNNSAAAQGNVTITAAGTLRINTGLGDGSFTNSGTAGLSDIVTGGYNAN